MLSSENQEYTDQNASVTYDVSPEQVRSEVASMIDRGDVSEEDIQQSSQDLLDDVEELAIEVDEMAQKLKGYPSLVGGYHGNVTNLEDHQQEWIEENATADMVATVEEAISMVAELLFRSQDLYDEDMDDVSSEDIDFDDVKSKYPELYNLWVVIPATMPDRAE